MYKSRFPEIIASLSTRTGIVAKAVAEQIADEARRDAPDAPPYGKGLKSDIKAEVNRFTYGGRSQFASAAREHGYQTPTSKGVITDTAYGVFTPWYWYFPEFGTVHSDAQPYMIPAVERAVQNIDSIARRALAGL
jgi:HK97 gp10 family phage protein